MIITDSRDIPIVAENFAKSIEGWFELLKNLPDMAWGVDEMLQLTPGLVRLCSLAYQLPLSDYCDDDLSDKENTNCEFISIRIDFTEEFRHYYTLRFPYEGVRNGLENQDIPVICDLVNDLYDICNNLQAGLEYYKKGMPYKAVNLWRDLFLTRWGEHASQVLYAMDHVMRDYLYDEYHGKHDIPFDSNYYPAIKYIDMDGYFVLHLDSSETLLPYEILIDSLGLAKDDVPMIGVAVGEKVIFVSVSDSPENLSRIGFPDQEKIFGWIKEHKEVLLKHWNKEISDRELANALFGEVMDILHPDHE